MTFRLLGLVAAAMFAVAPALAAAPHPLARTVCVGSIQNYPHRITIDAVSPGGVVSGRIDGTLLNYVFDPVVSAGSASGTVAGSTVMIRTVRSTITLTIAGGTLSGTYKGGLYKGGVLVRDISEAVTFACRPA